MTLRWREHPAATEELLAAIRFYHQQQPGLGADFDAQVLAAIHDLCEWPHSWPPVPGWNREPALRSRQVAIFPYRVIYFVNEASQNHDADEAIIVAYAHQSREPHYWQNRLPG